MSSVIAIPETRSRLEPGDAAPPTTRELSRDVARPVVSALVAVDDGIAKPTADFPQLNFINAAAWAGQEVPQRRWLVQNRIPMSKVTMLSGDGAAGKTTIAMQLAVGVVRGTDWLGAVVNEPGPVIFVSAEEDADEMHFRTNAIVEHHRISYSDLVGLHMHCIPGEDAVLGGQDRSGVVRATRLLECLEREAVEMRPALIVIEAAADVFAGNENDRSQVRQFVSLLQRLARTSGAAVLLIAHPSLEGLRSGTGTSGSTGWNNSVRSRLYFSGVKVGDETDEDVRELKVMKSNYGPKGETVRLRWQRCVFVPEGRAGTLQHAANMARIEQAYLDCLDAATVQRRDVGPLRSANYAPVVFEAMPQSASFKRQALGDAQERLFAAGRIEIQISGPPSKRRQHIVRKTDGSG